MTVYIPCFDGRKKVIRSLESEKLQRVYDRWVYDNIIYPEHAYTTYDAAKAHAERREHDAWKHEYEPYTIRHEGWSSFDHLEVGDRIINTLNFEVMGVFKDDDGFFFGNKNTVWDSREVRPEIFEIYRGNKNLGEYDEEYFRAEA